MGKQTTFAEGGNAFEDNVKGDGLPGIWEGGVGFLNDFNEKIWELEMESDGDPCIHLFNSA